MNLRDVFLGGDSSKVNNRLGTSTVQSTGTGTTDNRSPVQSSDECLEPSTGEVEVSVVTSTG